MSNDLRNELKLAFLHVDTIQELAKLYSEIQVECEKLLNCTAAQLIKEVTENAEKPEPL